MLSEINFVKWGRSNLVSYTYVMLMRSKVSIPTYIKLLLWRFVTPQYYITSYMNLMTDISSDVDVPGEQ